MQSIADGVLLEFILTLSFVGKQRKAIVTELLDFIAMGIPLPYETLIPNSSLAYYLSLAREHYGKADSAYYLDSDGLRMESPYKAIQAAEKSDVPFQWLFLSQLCSAPCLAKRLTFRAAIAFCLRQMYCLESTSQAKPAFVVL